ncbi:branched-chain amino acid ABC transporter permease [Chelativorans alearense]|uniref:branched-chain amino acid ABC transporter permease n=1 Tax=Chelativorans alearense TaxID=2681495 RepID=UPI0013D7BB36|nr:branched-chain amino acid ABC transporter permease [Chelativorans alearense]
MTIALSILVDGVAYGMILFMISVGLSVTMGLMRIVNLAHGGFALLGGAFAHVLTVWYSVPFIAALAISVTAVTFLAIPLERLVYRRIYRFGELEQVLATIGIVFVVIAGVNLFLGSTLLPIRMPPEVSSPVDIGFKVLPLHRIIVILAGLAVVAALYLLVEQTRFGIYLRAAVDNQDTAASLGINTSKVYLAAFALGAALAAIGGILGAELLPIEAYYPLRYMVLFLIVVAVGGLGSIVGSFLAALSLGILDTAGRYLLPDMGTIFFFLAITALLAVRPNGLLVKPS